MLGAGRRGTIRRTIGRFRRRTRGRGGTPTTGGSASRLAIGTTRTARASGGGMGSLRRGAISRGNTARDGSGRCADSSGSLDPREGVVVLSGPKIICPPKIPNSTTPTATKSITRREGPVFPTSSSSSPLRPRRSDESTALDADDAETNKSS